MDFPLQLAFKIIALAPQISVTDAKGAEVCYVRQKMFKLRESIDIFTDKSKSRKIVEIRANKVIDFSATYQFFDSNGKPFGAVARKGLRSIFKAHYDVLNSGSSPDMSIHEENPWIKVLDGLVDGIPIVGAIAGYVLNPSYLVTDLQSGAPLVRVRKKRTFLESRFTLEKLNDFAPENEMRIVLATLMMVLLERNRG